MSLKSGKLWIVATPLGNPGDLSLRAREILQSVDTILAEDTRRSGLLMQRCELHVSGFISYHDHNEQEKLTTVLAWLAEGKQLALISDAGTPLLSDPGFRLVRACREAGYEVSPVPGPSAPIAALSACGLPPLPFTFLGFLPRKKSECESLLAPFRTITTSLVFFERKDRLKNTLRAAACALGNRDGVIARELTKQFEEFISFTLDTIDQIPNELLGEITVVLGPPSSTDRSSESEAESVLLLVTKDGEKPKDTAKKAQGLLRGWSVKELYELMQKDS